MAMAVDNRQQSQLTGLGYDPLRGSYAVPHFTNPWVTGTSSTAAPSSQLYSTTQATSAGLDSLSQAAHRPTSISMPYSGLPVTASPLGPGSSLPGGHYDPSMIDPSQDLMNTSRSYAPQYTAAGTASYVPATSSYPIDYKYASYGNADRRSSHPSVPSIAMLGTSPIDVARSHQRQNSLIDFDRLNPQQRTSFSDAVEASRGMLAMSSDITPRNIYGDQGSSRSSSNSYGFPSTHSAHSSISSHSTYPSYYNGSVAESVVSDYSSASESVDMNSRTLPRPSTLMGGLNPPAPQSMMGQFSSKVSSSSQKKHKCKICDKRFTRPSSLQTHMYSHTGEKPFACEVEGCGRHFSVVSNLRRHRKVHKNENGGRDPTSADEA